MLFLTSCSVSRTSTSKTMGIYGSGVIHKPVLVDLDVQQTKVTGTATADKGSSMEEVKQNAVANALKNANADVLIEPTFETETSGGRITAKVTGWPGTYKNFRAITADDVPLLYVVGATQNAQVIEASKLQVIKGRK